MGVGLLRIILAGCGLFNIVSMACALTYYVLMGSAVKSILLFMFRIIVIFFPCFGVQELVTNVFSFEKEGVHPLLHDSVSVSEHCVFVVS